MVTYIGRDYTEPLCQSLESPLFMVFSFLALDLARYTAIWAPQDSSLHLLRRARPLGFPWFPCPRCDPGRVLGSRLRASGHYTHLPSLRGQSVEPAVQFVKTLVFMNGVYPSTCLW